MEQEKIENEISMIYLRLNNIEEKLDKALMTKEKQTELKPTAPIKTMYPAVCSQCGQSCTVPFKPNDGANIKCISCYRESKE